MAATPSIVPSLVVVLLLLAGFVAAAVSFGLVQTLLPVAIAATAAMLSAFVYVAWSRDAH